MREILFRGKRVDNGEWVQGFYVCKKRSYFKDKGVNLEHIICDNVEVEDGNYKQFVDTIMTTYVVNPETIGQYAGVTDVNGNKIFEGDFVKVTTGLEGYKSTYHSTIHRVTYDVCNCGVAVFYPFDNSDMIEAEVIGNIYDNPELLEK